MKRLLTKAFYSGIFLSTLVFQAGCHHHRYNDDYYYDHHHGWHHGHGDLKLQIKNSEGQILESSVFDLAQDFDISENSARRIIALTTPETQPKDFKRLGINIQELESMSQLEMPKPETLQKIGSALGEDTPKIERLIDSFISDMKADKTRSPNL